MYCINCGAKLPPGHKFCGMCGTRVPVIEDIQPAPVAETKEEPAPQPVVQPEPIPQPVVQPEPVPEPVVQSEPIPQPVVQPEPVPEPVVQPEPIPQPVVQPEPVPEPIVQPEPVPQPVVQPEPIPEPIPEPVEQPFVQPEPIPQPVHQPEPVPQPVVQPEPVSQPIQPQPVSQPQYQPQTGETVAPLDFVSAVKLAVGNIMNFGGRARRSEFWWWTLVVSVAAVVFLFIPYLRALAVLGWTALVASAVVRRLHDSDAPDIIAFAFIGLSLVFSVFNGLRLLGVVDEVYSLERAFYGGSGAVLNLLYLACGIITLIAWGIVVFFAVKDSGCDDNKWGQNPKSAAS
ncbi:DUF805 domain-containing protein [uncultured Prevotella sp.]|uniref:DUF805 domain-containing protein n=1 Tax=uncultured Prevotella sp. TaxID=159272 RepID=UPI00263844C7|nr:DUF805 domain-containing protein [uncultured Prevotella sp.]